MELMQTGSMEVGQLLQSHEVDGSALTSHSRDRIEINNNCSIDVWADGRADEVMAGRVVLPVAKGKRMAMQNLMRKNHNNVVYRFL
jgi:hypothetical protein